MDDIFVSEFWGIDDEFEKLGVFDSIMNRDSHFFINLLRLKRAHTPEFQGSYGRVNEFYDRIMILLDGSQKIGDKLYRTALNSFSFSGVNGINLGFSETGVDAGFGPVLSQQVIKDAYEIVKSGSKQPEIFQLVGLFEENVGADRLSDMIATIILPDIQAYTRRINQEMNITPQHYPDVSFHDGIAINPYKNCELLYLPEEVLHELPIARGWDDIDRVIAENRAIREEVNEVVGLEWAKMYSSEKKNYLKEKLFKDVVRCGRLIESYREEDIGEYSKTADLDYFIADVFRGMKKSGVFNFLEHSDNLEIGSWDAAIKVLSIFKEWVECNKGWDEIMSLSTQKREKSVQRLLHLSSKYYCTTNNIDITFEANEGPGPVDVKVSRGNDKTVIEIKLSSNPDYLHGYEEQIETYAKAEGTTNRIFVYIQVGNPIRDDKIQRRHQERVSKGENPPMLFMIDAQKRVSASKV